MNYNIPDNNNGMPCVYYTDVIGIAPAAPISLGPSRAPTYMSSDNNIRSLSDNNSVPVINLVSPIPVTGPILNNYYVNETDRGQVDPTVNTQINLKGPNQWNNLSYLDPVRNTTKETTEFSYLGNPEQQKNGTTFWTYLDAPKTKTAETTMISYIANPNQQKTGQTFWTYLDTLKTTTKETTQASYIGSVAPATNRSDVSRFQYTGNENEYNGNGGNGYYNMSAINGGIGGMGGMGGMVETFSNNTDQNNKYQNNYNSNGRMSGGAKKYSIKSSTLVQDWVPGAGRSNILLDPDASIGRINFKGQNDYTENGPGTFAQSIPDASRSQYQQIIAAPTSSANKTIALDDRQIANYQVMQLKNNPLSIYTTNPNGEIPNLYAFNSPTTYSSLSPEPQNIALDRINNQFTQNQIDTSGGIGHLYPVNVYPPTGNIVKTDTKNPVMNIFNGLGFDNSPEKPYFNPMLEQGSSNYYKEPVFQGISYSGTFINNTNKDSIYGPTQTYRPREYGDAGIEHPIEMNGQEYVCEGNRALSYNTDDLYINRNLY